MTGKIELLERLSKLLWLFGTANDADDHNCGTEGAELRERAAVGIRELIQEHPFVLDVLPTLEWELQTGHIQGFGWSNLLDVLEREVRTLRTGPAGAQ